jgi:hypothetical protein
MKHDWQELMDLSRNEDLVVERVRLAKRGIAIEGEFDLPPLAHLTMEDQTFIIAFVRCHGSIKEMETLFGVSYPTIKSRLNRIAAQVEFVEVNPVSARSDILDRLEKGEITVDDAEAKLRRTHGSTDH